MENRKKIRGSLLKCLEKQHKKTSKRVLARTETTGLFRQLSPYYYNELVETCSYMEFEELVKILRSQLNVQLLLSQLTNINLQKVLIKFSGCIKINDISNELFENSIKYASTEVKTEIFIKNIYDVKGIIRMFEVLAQANELDYWLKNMDIDSMKASFIPFIGDMGKNEIICTLILQVSATAIVRLITADENGAFTEKMLDLLAENNKNLLVEVFETFKELGKKQYYEFLEICEPSIFSKLKRKMSIFSGIEDEKFLMDFYEKIYSAGREEFENFSIDDIVYFYRVLPLEKQKELLYEVIYKYHDGEIMSLYDQLAEEEKLKFLEYMIEAPKTTNYKKLQEIARDLLEEETKKDAGLIVNLLLKHLEAEAKKEE